MKNKFKEWILKILNIEIPKDNFLEKLTDNLVDDIKVQLTKQPVIIDTKPVLMVYVDRAPVNQRKLDYKELQIITENLSKSLCDFKDNYYIIFQPGEYNSKYFISMEIISVEY